MGSAEPICDRTKVSEDKNKLISKRYIFGGWWIATVFCLSLDSG